MRIKTRMAGIVAGATAAVVLNSGAASAWTTSPPDTDFTSTSANLMLVNQAGTVALDCSPSTATVSANGVNDNPVADITSLSLGPCPMSTGWLLSVTTPDPPFTPAWPLTGVSYADSVTTSSLTGINGMTITGPGCFAELEGGVASTYTNPTTPGGAGTLAVSTPGNSLQVASGNNCLGIFPVSSFPKYSGTYNVPNGPTIVNP